MSDTVRSLCYYDSSIHWFSISVCVQRLLNVIVCLRLFGFSPRANQVLAFYWWNSLALFWSRLVCILWRVILHIISLNSSCNSSGFSHFDLGLWFTEMWLTNVSYWFYILSLMHLYADFYVAQTLYVCDLCSE